jgi:hypothetical protein
MNEEIVRSTLKNYCSLFSVPWPLQSDRSELQELKQARIWIGIPACFLRLNYLLFLMILLDPKKLVL